MLTIYGAGGHRFCDGISRRSFLQVGGLALGAFGGLSLADVMRAEAAEGKRPGHKAVINIFLAGGPPHQDMWDIKSDAPSDIRGEFKAINTKVDGIQICEVFPRIAGLADKCAFIRSVVGSAGDHDGYQCMSGWSRRALPSQGGYPGMGSVAAKVLGPVDRAVPVSVGLAPPAQASTWSENGSAGYLGAGYAPFRPFAAGSGSSSGLDVIKLNGMSLERLQNRRRMLQSLDACRRDLDANLNVQDRDATTAAAFDLLTSSKLADALDLSKEDAKVRERYGTGKPYQYTYDGVPTNNELLLMSRRLVEAGCRVVSLSFGRWDSHGDNFTLVRDHGGKLDQCVSALIEDLHTRGMLQDVSVAVWGEFGRTPKINPQAGRDHWPQVSCALLAGGGMKTGQVIGATNALGEYATERPVHFQEIIATLYHNLGINVETTLIEDRTGRPTRAVEQTQPIEELVG
ncbi:MAG: hypothetical protein K0Q72_4525 [Armatimonadetes bacterium]|jgi:uncharacterized protein (DUF1501 family)|nr:hypothetical protein [Armatimonadota bacterium]